MPPPYPFPGRPRATERNATLAFALGLLSVFCLGPISGGPAIALGILSRRAIAEARGALRGGLGELQPELRARRREQHLTQEDLAAVIGVNRRVVGELERGKGTVRLEIALAAARALGLDVELTPRGPWAS